MSYGRGAGREPTASAIVSDALNIASGWYPKAFADMKLWSDGHDPINLIDPDDLISRFYIRVNALDQPGVIAEVTKLLGDSGISLTAVIQHEINLGQFVPLAITTHDARQGDVIAALKKIEGLSTIEGSPVCIHIVEEPEG
jgi:homoserine dehydrogenase